MNKWKVALYCLVSFISTCSFADTRVTVIESAKEHTITNLRPVLINGLLIYQTADEGEYKLWAYNTTTQEKQNLLATDIISSSNIRFRSNHLLLLNNQLVFTALNGETVTFFTSDGTPEGTTILESPALALVSSYYKDDLLFTWAEDGQLVTTNGETVSKHPIQYAETNKVCGFNNNDVIALENSPVPATIVSSKDGVRTNLSETLLIDFSSVFLSMLRINNYCLISGYADSKKEAILVAQTGEVSVLSEQFDLTQFNGFFVFKDRLYAFQELADLDEKKLVRFNENYDGIDKEFAVDDTDRFFSVSNSQNFIIAQSVSQNTSQITSVTYFFDRNLELNQTLSGLNKPSLSAHPILDGEIYSASIKKNNRFVKALSTNPDFPSTQSTFIVDQKISGVITSPESLDVYLLLEDPSFQSFSVAKLTDKPNINYSTAGLWFDPAIPNQGLVINRGKRANGSNYLFVSVYTMDQGAPLWLAGISDINLPQQNIQIELSSHEGANFFEENSNPSRTLWGSVELEMTGCNNLKATFTQPGSDTRVVDLIRIDNTSFDTLCSD